MQLVLSLCTGAGLLDYAFKKQGFCVVSAGDIIYNIGADIRDFAAPFDKFDGIIAGTPCQGFSDANRDRPGKYSFCNYSFNMIKEFERIILEVNPKWFLLENVRNVPDLFVTEPGQKNVTDRYKIQRFDINQSWFEPINRLRHIQFGSINGNLLNIKRGKPVSKKCDSAALASDSRTYEELLKLQGISDLAAPTLEDFTIKGKKKLIGNGVPFVIGNVLAKEVKRVMCDSTVVENQRYCKCGCGRVVTGRSDKKYYDYSCRKRYQRRLDSNILTSTQL